MTAEHGQPSKRATAGTALQRASRILLGRQDSQGWWSGRVTGDVTLEAEGLLVREALGIRTAELTNAAAQEIRSMQQADGRWTGDGELMAGSPAGPGSAGDLSASVLAYLALRLAGDSADSYHMAVAAGWIRDAGGSAAAGVTARTWLAIFGLTGWADVRVPAPEFIFLPVRYAASLHDWSAWSRPAAAALAIIGTLRPVRQLPLDLSELRAGGAVEAVRADRRRSRRVPVLNVAQSASLRKCGQWLIDWQQRQGLPAARRPSWPCSLVALHLLGYSLHHPVLANGLAWLDSVTAQPRPAAGSARPPAARQPLVMDTVLAVVALADAGLAADDPALAAAGNWLLLQRIEGPADGLGVPSGPAPCGWSFGRDGYPMAADTAHVLLALSRVELPGLTGRPAVRNATRWLTGMQGRDGDWSGSAEVTALVVSALVTHGAADARAIRRGVVWLLRRQQPDGSWPGGHGPGDLRATATVLRALLAAGVQPGKAAVSSGTDWLRGEQNLDGGWTSDVGRPADSGQAEHGTRALSDPAGTARAVSALLTTGLADTTDSVDLGADWLVRAQQADGGWNDPGSRPAGRNLPRRRGSVLPGLLLPLSALGRYVAAGPGAGDAAEDGGLPGVLLSRSVASGSAQEPAPVSVPPRAAGLRREPDRPR